MLDFFRRLLHPRITPMNTIYISRSAILHNLGILQKLQPNMSLFPVIKSNAYGHWLKEMSKILDTTDVAYLVVDSYPEYAIVKKYSKKNILLLWETLPENYRFFDPKRVTFCVYNLQTLEKLGRRAKHIKIHIFINTGMYREWANPETLSDYIKILQNYPKIQLEWVLSHFHSADTKAIQSLQTQIEAFKKAYYTFLDAGYTPIYRYIANSAWLLKIDDDFFNAARPWLALYGYNPLHPDDEYYDKGKKLQPALRVTSKVVALQEVAWGQWVSYEYQRISPQATTIAVIPFGYAEWLSRSASNQLTFSRKGKKIQQVGRITMNLSCTDVSNYNVSLGDEIEIIAAKADAHNSIYSLAEKSGTIVYENLVKLDAKIRKVVK
jgi:alanine racemase